MTPTQGISGYMRKTTGPGQVKSGNNSKPWCRTIHSRAAALGTGEPGPCHPWTWMPSSRLWSTIMARPNAAIARIGRCTSPASTTIDTPITQITCTIPMKP